MDLWNEFQIGERITGMWKELGISAGTAIVVLIVLYFVIKWAVKNGIIEAHKKIAEKKKYDNYNWEFDKKAFDSASGDDNTSTSKSTSASE